MVLTDCAWVTRYTENARIPHAGRKSFYTGQSIRKPHCIVKYFAARLIGFYSFSFEFS
jgi:hypothetical protein